MNKQFTLGLAVRTHARTRGEQSGWWHEWPAGGYDGTSLWPSVRVLGLLAAVALDAARVIPQNHRNFSKVCKAFIIIIIIIIYITVKGTKPTASVKCARVHIPSFRRSFHPRSTPFSHDDADLDFFSGANKGLKPHLMKERIMKRG